MNFISSCCPQERIGRTVTLKLLVTDTKEKGIKAIAVETTEMGDLLYEKFVFVEMNHEMELLERKGV